MSAIDEKKFQFGVADSIEQVREVLAISKNEWGGAMTPECYVEHFTLEFGRQLEEGKELRAFYIKDVAAGIPVASCIVNQMNGFFREADRSQPIASTPDPAAFGVKNVVVLHLEMVFVHEEYRGKKLGETVVGKSIEYVEKHLIDKEVAASDPNANDSFASMVKDSLGKVDPILANYYLSKKYVWHLYSSADTFYSRFGFKSYPLPVYLLPLGSLLFMNETLDYLLQNTAQKLTPFGVPGKLLQLLDFENPQHQQIIQGIYQAKELEIMMDLNKTTFHLQLSGQHNSSSSLTNMSSILSFSKSYGGSGSSGALALMALPEVETGLTKSSKTEVHSPPERRQSTVMHAAVSKFAVKPDFQLFSNFARAESVIGDLRTKLDKQKEDDNNEDPNSWNIKGAILTNELQRKSYYVLWQCLLGGCMFCIVGMGEISGDIAGNGAFSVLPFPSRRRGSSFTGINDLGGINFQDLDILLATAARIVSLRNPFYSRGFLVSPNDLPQELPTAMAYDYFMNYLPSKRADGTNKDNEIEFHESAGPVAGILPMLKKFGDTSTSFDLDWVFNGLWAWS